MEVINNNDPHKKHKRMVSYENYPDNCVLPYHNALPYRITFTLFVLNPNTKDAKGEHIKNKCF